MKLDTIPGRDKFKIERLCFRFCLLLLIGLQGCSGIWTNALKRGYTLHDDFHKEIEVEVDKGYIFIPVYFRGKVYKFLFDTGAPFSISEELQNTESFGFIRRARIIDSDGNAKKVNLVTVDSLEISGVPFFNYTAFVADFKANPDLKCLNIDGIIGSNLIRTCNWSVDFQNKIVELTNKRADSFPDDVISIPFETDFQYNILVDFNIAGTPLKSLTIDYGSNGSISLPIHGFESLKQTGAFENTFKETGYSQSGLLGKPTPITREIAFIDTLRSGNLIFEDIEIRSGGRLIGTRVLKRYVMSINWTDKILTFDKVDSIAINHKKFGFQIGYSDGGKYYVSSVIEHSSAFKAGLQPNMTILKVDSLDISPDLDYCDFIDFTEQIDNSVYIEAASEDGERIKVKIERQLLTEN